MKNIAVKMLRTLDGSPDGIEIKTYEAGRSYDLPSSLVNNFVGQGAAELVKGKAMETKKPEVENKSTKPESNSSAPTEENVKKEKANG